MEDGQPCAQLTKVNINIKGVIFKMATLKDAAREAGVFVPTVSHVISNYQYIREATKVKVLEGTQKLDYSKISMGLIKEGDLLTKQDIKEHWNS